MNAREHLEAVRDQLARERDRLDAQLELLDRLLALVVDTEEPETNEGSEERGLAPTPPPTSTGAVVPRFPRPPQSRPTATPRHASAKAKPPTAPPPEADTPPTPCGQGDKVIQDGTHLETVVTAIRGRAPHWLSHDGIVEATYALGIEPPKTFRAMVNQYGKQLRTGDYDVPGLEWRTVGRRVEYRIVVTEEGQQGEAG